MQQTPEEELLTNWDQLGPNARKILVAISARMAMGNRLYGDFPSRTWTKEAGEEALDQIIYLAASLVFDGDR